MRAGIVASIAGAAAAAGLTIYAGRYRLHSPPLLLVLFALWVASPFLGILLAHFASPGWAQPREKVLRVLAVALALASCAIYAATGLLTARPKTAVFVLVPPASWLLIAAVLLATVRNRQRA